MKRSFLEFVLGINPDEVISVGKYWLWMTVFSTCLFASCGETDRHSQKPISPEPKTQAIPARYDREVIHTEDSERDELNPEQIIEFPDVNMDDFDLERFEDDDAKPDALEELGEPEEELVDEGQEVHKISNLRDKRVNVGTEVALRELPDSANQTEQKPSSPPAPSPVEAKDPADPHAKWVAQFQNIGDSDEFKSDSPDHFE